MKLSKPDVKTVDVTRSKLSSISNIRRTELRQAAFAVLQREGSAGTTLERVAAEVGASKGIVLHYFANKQELFEHAMREANAALATIVVKKLRTAATPLERVYAIIDGNFEPRLFTPPTCQAWLSLCEQVPRDRNLARIQKVIHARMRSNLLSGLRGLTSEENAESLALSIRAMIDGLWLQLGLHPGGISSAGAIRMVRDHLHAQLAYTPIGTNSP